MYIVYFNIGQEWPNNSFHLIRHMSHYYEQIEANITQNDPTMTSWPPWWPHLSQRDVFKTWEWQFDKRTVVNISRTFKAVSNLLGTNAKIGKYHRWNGESRSSLLSQNVILWRDKNNNIRGSCCGHVWGLRWWSLEGSWSEKNIQIHVCQFIKVDKEHAPYSPSGLTDLVLGVP